MEQLVAHPQVALPDVPAVGDVLAEKYRVEGILGVGGMGVVLGARHLQLGQLVAIKVLSVSGEQQGDSVERFLREGRAAAALNSDHVVRIYDVGQLPTGLPFMVMERLRGQDLSSRLAEVGPLSIEDAVEYVAQATVAIIEAHEVGIVHRDLKPANLFLTQRSDGSACIKVLDFGISKQLTDVESQTLQGALTSTRQVMGSPAYMSPEQVRDAKTVDHRTDIWALGITLYELLTQHAAFDADTLPAVCAAIAADPPIPIRSLRPDVPFAVESIVRCCLEKVPAKRYATARALLTALRDFQGKVLDSGTRSEPKSPATESSASVEAALHLPQKPQSPWNESGPHSVGTVPQDSMDGTLVSGRTPLVGGQILDKPSNRGRNFAVVALGVLVLSGAGTAWFVVHRPELNPPAAPKATDNLPAGKSPTDKPPVEAKTHFVLSITSEPSQALVLEAGNPLGVTPLSIAIDRTVVQRGARQFVVRKVGFTDIGLQQGDSSTDVQQNVALEKVAPTASETQSTKPLNKAPMKRPGPTSSPAPSSGIPAIRITR